jgi:hypothetical protein
LVSSSILIKTLQCCRDRDEGEVRVYPGKLQEVQAQWCTVRIDSNTTIEDLTKLALDAFGMPDASAEDFRMSEVLLDRGGKYITFLHIIVYNL